MTVTDPVSSLKLRDSSLGRLAMLGALAGAAGVTAYLAWPARRSSASTRKHQALIAYLRDHLSGSDIAIRVVDRLGSTHQGTEDGRLFLRLSKELEEDRSVVRELLRRLGASGRSLKRVPGYASGVVLSVTAGGEPGDLSLLRTLEALAIGVQGKRCMWRALQNLRPVPPTVHGMDFVELEAQGGSPMGGHRGAPARLGGADLFRDRASDGVTAITWIRGRSVTLEGVSKTLRASGSE